MEKFLIGFAVAFVIFFILPIIHITEPGFWDGCNYRIVLSGSWVTKEKKQEFKYAKQFDF